MKFSQVKIGDQFSYQGEDYTKSGPLTATLESDGRSKLVPRSANVKLLNNDTQQQLLAEDYSLSASRVMDTINRYHARNLDYISSLKTEIPAELLADIQIQLNNHYEQCLQEIKADT